MGHPDEVGPHRHNDNDDYCHLSAKYTEYIKIHLKDLQSKCDHLTVCINKLLSQQSPMSVLNGEDLELKKICQLINVKGNDTSPMLDGKCYFEERIDIMEDVENHLKDKMEKRDNWESVAVCLENNYGDKDRTTYIGDLCGIVEKKGQICAYNTHRHVERFINDQIDHLQCTCKALNDKGTDDQSHGLSIATLAGIGLGALLLICIILGLACFCHRRKQRRKKKKAPNVIYLPAATDNCPVYQEIFDQRPSPNPPALPSRYNSRPLPGHPDEAEYLEPVQAQAALNSYRSKAPSQLQKLVHNPGYDVNAPPPEYSETDQTYEEAVLMNPDEVDAYFEPIESPKNDQAQGYDTLDVRENNDDDNSSLPDEYQPLEDISSDRKLGPVPAERTKKSDRPVESEYFELEMEHTTV